MTSVCNIVAVKKNEDKYSYIIIKCRENKESLMIALSQVKSAHPISYSDDIIFFDIFVIN